MRNFVSLRAVFLFSIRPERVLNGGNVDYERLINGRAFATSELETTLLMRGIYDYQD